MTYKIFPIPLGIFHRDRSKMLYLAPAGSDMEAYFGMFALEDEDGKFILVDSGIPSKEEIRKNGYPFEEPEVEYDFSDQLKKRGIIAEKVKLIILTHLHWDHCWNLEKFPNAEILVQRAELEHAITPYKHEKTHYCMEGTAFGKGWMKATLQMRALEGDMMIQPGIYVVTTPGHTPGSQSVLVNTKTKKYLLVGDMMYCKESVEKRIAVANVLDVYQWYQSYDKIMNYDAEILSSHDSMTYKWNVYGE